MTISNFAPKAPRNPRDKFHTAKGWLTPYALHCGYIEKFSQENDIVNRAVEMWHEGGSMYHVRAHNFKRHERMFWESFYGIADARALFAKTRKEWSK